jgi:hypothetical protein
LEEAHALFAVVLSGSKPPRRHLSVQADGRGRVEPYMYDDNKKVSLILYISTFVMLVQLGLTFYMPLSM